MRKLAVWGIVGLALIALGLAAFGTTEEYGNVIVTGQVGAEL